MEEPLYHLNYPKGLLQHGPRSGPLRHVNVRHLRIEKYRKTRNGLIYPIRRYRRPIIGHYQSYPKRPHRSRNRVRSLPGGLLMSECRFSRIRQVNLRFIRRSRGPTPLSTRLSHRLNRLRLLQLNLLSVPTRLRTRLGTGHPGTTSESTEHRITRGTKSHVLSLLSGSHGRTLKSGHQDYGRGSRLKHPLNGLPRRRHLTTSTLTRRRHKTLFTAENDLRPLTRALRRPFPTGRA